MRLLALAVLLAGCGGSEFDGTWAGSYVAVTARGFDTDHSGEIVLEIDGARAEGLLSGVPVRGDFHDGRVSFPCHHDACTPFVLPVDVAGDLDVVTGRLVGSLGLTGVEDGRDAGSLRVEMERE